MSKAARIIDQEDPDQVVRLVVSGIFMTVLMARARNLSEELHTSGAQNLARISVEAADALIDALVAIPSTP